MKAITTRIAVAASLIIALAMACTSTQPPDAEAIASLHISSEGHAIARMAAETIEEHTDLPAPIADRLIDAAMEATLTHACVQTQLNTDDALVECVITFSADIGFDIDAEAPLIVTVDLDTAGKWASPYVTSTAVIVDRVTINGSSLSYFEVPQIGITVPSISR